MEDYVFLRLSTKYVTDTAIAKARIATIIINLPVKEIGARSTGGDGTGDSDGGVGAGAVGVGVGVGVGAVGAGAVGAGAVGAGAVGVTSRALFSLVIAIREKHFVSA